MDKLQWFVYAAVHCRVHTSTYSVHQDIVCKVKPLWCIILLICMIYLVVKKKISVFYSYYGYYKKEILLKLIHNIDIYYLEFVSAVRIYVRSRSQQMAKFFLKSRKCYFPTVRAKYKCVRRRWFLFLMYAAHCASLKIPQIADVTMTLNH